MYSYVSSVHFFTYWPGQTLIKFIHFICWKHLRLMRTTECLQKFHLIFSCSPKYHQPINKGNLHILITSLKLLNYLNGKRPSLWPIRENIFPQNNSLTFAIIHSQDFHILLPNPRTKIIGCEKDFSYNFTSIRYSPSGIIILKLSVLKFLTKIWPWKIRIHS